MFMFLSRHYSQLTKIEAKTIGYAPLETWKLGLILFCLDTASVQNESRLNQLITQVILLLPINITQVILQLHPVVGALLVVQYCSITCTGSSRYFVIHSPQSTVCNKFIGYCCTCTRRVCAPGRSGHAPQLGIHCM